MKLSSAESLQLVEGLKDAFPNRIRLEMILAAPPVEQSPAKIFTNGTLLDNCFQLVQVANAEGWIGRLLDGLRAASGVNPDLIAMINRFDSRNESGPQRIGYGNIA